MSRTMMLPSRPLRLSALAAALLCATSAPAQTTDAGTPPACGQDESCDALLFRVQSAGETKPLTDETDPASLQRNRRVEITRKTGVGPAQPGRGVIAGEFSLELPKGGLVWATEDPTLGQPVLSMLAPSSAAFAEGRITAPVVFQGYSNYPSFIQRVEITVYRGSDADRIAPLATIALAPAAMMKAEWDGRLDPAPGLQPGDELVYVTRAYDSEGRFDETAAQRIQLLTPADHERGRQAAVELARKTLGTTVSAEQAQALIAVDAVYGRNALQLQNIPIQGSRVRIHGRNIAEEYTLSIDGQSIPIDMERKFVAEFLEPVGRHSYRLEVTKSGHTEILGKTLDVDVDGKHRFLVALADLTLSHSDVSGNVEPLAGDDRFSDGFLAEGRLAFYLKGKIKGRYLLTAQADTREREIRDLFTGFLDADPRDVFRRLDPDAYYPVYGDDSTTMRDVDSQGRLYVRLEWDRSQAVWGNFATGFTGTEYGQYKRSLYGAALAWRSPQTTALGDSRSLLRAFVSQAQSALGHSEFLGTGGSLYYLRHTDVLPGSERLVLEIRDRTTGRVERRVDLQRGADYEIDELQGRVILSRPLAQITRENVRTLTRDGALDGFDQLLLADYEYVPAGFDADDASIGLRGRQWFGEHVALGGTFVEENRGGDDYGLRAFDLTLQAGRGTYLKFEQARSEATVAPVFYSDNGGLSFLQRNPGDGPRQGDARVLEARANFRELGWSARDWSVGAWKRDVDAGFSIARFDNGVGSSERGVEFLGEPLERLQLYGRWTEAERGANAVEQGQLNADWRMAGDGRLGAELRQVRERTGAGETDATLAALSYRQRIGDALELYGTGQFTVDDDGGAYPANDRITVGSRYLFADRSSLGAELSDGDRGRSARVEGEYRLAPDHTLYGSYNYSTDRTTRDPLFDTALQRGWTLGQRWRLSEQVGLFNESQYLKDPRDDATGITHVFGMDFYPAKGWNLGFSVQDGELDAASGAVDRRAYSVSGSRNSPAAQWTSKLEFRRDSGAERREQWVTTHRLLYKIDEDWRIAARANYADTDDLLKPAAGAKLAEANLGFAWRPHDSTRWAAFGRYTYLYDLASSGQIGGAEYDQRSQVLALEGIAQIDERWELAGKLASRRGDYRLGRGAGTWLDSRADFAALQLRYRLIREWDGLAEYRWLHVRDGGLRQGVLVGVDRELGENFRVGIGFNFTDFSDDLTDLRYDNRGWFLNLAGYY